MKKLYFAAVATAMILTSLPALAMQSTFSLQGTVLDADFPNGFDLNPGDTISAEGIFENTLTGIGYEEILFDQGSGNHMTIHVGSMSFDETQEEDYFYGGYPLLEFFYGDLELVGYTTASDDPYFSSWDDFYGESEVDTDYPYIWGLWDFDTLEIGSPPATSLPEPGTLSLLAIGLLGSFWARRRQQS